MDAFEVALYPISPRAVSDQVLRHRVGFLAVKDLMVDQYRKDLSLKLVQIVLAQKLRSPTLKVNRRRTTRRIIQRDGPEANNVEGDVESTYKITTIEEGSEEDEGNSVKPTSHIHSSFMTGKYSSIFEILCHFSPFLWILLKLQHKK